MLHNTSTLAGFMPLDKQKIDLVQKTWYQVQPVAERAVSLFYDKMFTLDIIQAAHNAGYVSALFYSRLFELDPSLRYLFGNDMQRQGRKLMEMITIAVNGLERIDGLVHAVRQLGARHADYGVQAAHYDTVAQALLWTLSQVMGEKFTPEVEAAWTETYVTLATVMQQGAAVAKAKAEQQAE